MIGDVTMLDMTHWPLGDVAIFNLANIIIELILQNSSMGTRCEIARNRIFTEPH